MFEARFQEASSLKKVIESIRELLVECQWECSNAGMSLQAMDSSHVSLVGLLLRGDGFDLYRCDRNMTMGINLVTMSKILKCAANTDVLTLKADDDGDSMTFVFESSDGDRVCDYNIKLMDIDTEHLGIPDTEYNCVVKMPSSEFQRICRDISQIGETVTITVTKEGVCFSSTGDIGSGNIKLKPTSIDETDSAKQVTVAMTEPVSLRFSLKYLTMFSKATPLSESVSLSMSPEVPIVVEYKMGEIGYVRYYLAPKVDEDGE